MSELKKPEKKELPSGGVVVGYQAFNKACDQWQAYHDQEIEALKKEHRKMKEVKNEIL